MLRVAVLAYQPVRISVWFSRYDPRASARWLILILSWNIVLVTTSSKFGKVRYLYIKTPESPVVGAARSILTGVVPLPRKLG